MTEFNILVFAAAAVVLLLGLSSGVAKAWLPVSEPMIAIAAGILIGPLGMDWLRLEALGDPHAITEQVARMTITVAVVTAAVRLPPGFFTSRKVIGPAIALGPGMLAMWGVSSLLAWGFLEVDAWTAVLIGAVVTPTDPVLAGAIVSGRLAESTLPKGLRSLISGESGANDGLGYPFVWLPLLMVHHPTREALSKWLLETWLWEVLAAAAVGLAAGWLASLLLRGARKAGLTGETSMVTITLALAFTSVAAVKLMGSDGILAAFCAGATFRVVTHDRTDEENEQFQEAAKRFFELPVFVLFGMILPVEAWAANPYAFTGLAVAVLLLRRPPAFLALTRVMPQTKDTADRAFVSWFGPVGIAALFYALLSLRHGAAEIVWHAASAVILASAVVHGITSTPATRRFRKGQEEAGRGSS
ncbi:hypothetical protein C882_3526 [Caenispirillum salinarum AK4]|uniref:Cation/H+ exchanger transmembrane domain-containing protein n=1 Tax=Caenispirillum salinarum AK4 TaxID=1238182 RepID=K9H0J9_9PROT|nr:cation:proton antiporter [Caenispirillum salinarum]EKV31775.1 hypothetical protein C882_3526 [Caenispirillum salinarum AK4]